MLLDRLRAAYAPQDERPLGSFLALLGAYGATVAAGGAVVHATNAELPPPPTAGDVVLLGIATHKIARLIAKDPVTSPIRAPFTQFQGASGEAEVAEEVRGAGPRKAIGELVTCPFCMGQWVATGLAFGYILAPRSTRWVASTFAAITVADFLQLGYAAAQEAQQKLGDD